MGHTQAAGPGTAAGRHTGALVRTLVGTAAFMLVEVIGGLWTGSLALLADAAHMLTDVGGLGLALFAIWMAAKPPTPNKTYGYYRVEILAALINAVVLFVIAIAILVEAYRRFFAPPEVRGGPMLVIAVIGLGVNLAGLWFLRRGSEESLNLHGAYLEVLGDALGSVGVIVAALVVLVTDWYPADPLISVGIGLFILPRTWGVLRKAVNVLLEGTPSHIDVRALEAAMHEIAGVRRVHDLHVWTLTSGKEAMSAHVVVDGVAEGDRLTQALHDLLHERFGVEHTTIQLESDRSPLIQVVPRNAANPDGSGATAPDASSHPRGG